MTEVTRVPLQPIAKGSLVKLWIGVIVAALIGIGVAWAAVPGGVSVETVEAGSGPNPGPADVVFVNYVGKLPSGEVFDQSQELPIPVQGIFPEGTPLPLDGMIPGFREGAQQMQKGGKYVMTIPPSKGYGEEAQTNPQTGEEIIPGNSELIFEVTLNDFMSREDFDRRLAVLQQVMAQQQGAQQGAQGEGGAEGAPAPAPVPQN